MTLSHAQLVEGLKRAFDGGDGRYRIVFWHDERREFDTLVGNLPLPELAEGGVTLVRLDETGALEAKLRIERQARADHFLLYAPFAQPPPENDWLLDVRLYSRAFHADQASMIMAELGLERQTLKAHLDQRLAFFAGSKGQKSLVTLRELVSPHDDEAEIDLKMMVVLSGAKTTDLDHIVIALAHGAVTKDHGDMAATVSSGDGSESTESEQSKAPDGIKHTLRFGLDSAFWRMVEERYGFADTSPTLDKLLARMMMTEFSRKLRHADVPSELQHLLLAKGGPNAQHCLGIWRDSMRHYTSFDKWSRYTADKQSLPVRIAGMRRDQVELIPTFIDCEKLVLASMMRELMTAAEDVAQPFDLAAFQAAIATRKSSYWVKDDYQDGPKVARSVFLSSYLALEAASEFVDLYREHAAGFSYDSADQLWAAYVTKLYRFDSSYRRLNEHAQKVAGAQADFLKPLQGQIEQLYCNWYLESLADAWIPFVEKSSSSGAAPLLEAWRLENASSQSRFFEKYVRAPLTESTGPKRVFVIISDALRFEVAQELSTALTRTYRYQPQLDSMLGVVPSYTKLGMASLLPHTVLSYEKSGVVKADGKTTEGLENRSKILATVKGVAFDADELRGRTKDDARAAINGFEVIYMYERGIDSVADKGATEDETFAVARRTIEKLRDMVAFAINTLNASYVVVTADHGFLYTNSKPTEVDKSALGEKPEGAYVTKKRYVVGQGLPAVKGAIKGKLAKTSDVAGDEEFLVPTGTQLFHFTGGARFVHGGLMPQEIVVPVITVKKLRGKAATDQRPSPVEYQLLGGPHRIVNNRHRFELMQMEAVEGRRLPARVKFGVYEGTVAVSDEHEVLLDSKSAELGDRKREVWLSIKGELAKKQCQIVMRNLDTDQVKTVPVTIDIAFSAVDF
jgi:uncharacterized protein (TIGR02687 family)